MPEMEPSGREELVRALQSEQDNQRYGTVTRKLVGTYQEERGLQSTGAVDDNTAVTLNADLRRLGLVDDPLPVESGRPRIVSGRITNADGFPVRGAIVRAFHTSDSSSIRLGDDTTDAEGVYTISIDTGPKTVQSPPAQRSSSGGGPVCGCQSRGPEERIARVSRNKDPPRHFQAEFAAPVCTDP